MLINRKALIILLLIFVCCISCTKKELTYSPDLSYSQMKQLMQKSSALNNEGFEYLENGKLDEAESLFLQSIEAYPKDSMPYINLSNLYFSQKKYDKSIETLENAIQQKVISKDINYNLGFSYMYNKNYSKAKEFFNKVLNEDSGDLYTLINLGNVAGYEGNYDEAMEYFQEALKVNDQFAPVYYNLGNLYYQKGENAKGEEYHNKAVQLDPSFKQLIEEFKKSIK